MRCLRQIFRNISPPWQLWMEHYLSWVNAYLFIYKSMNAHSTDGHQMFVYLPNSHTCGRPCLFSRRYCTDWILILYLPRLFDASLVYRVHCIFFRAIYVQRYVNANLIPGLISERHSTSFSLNRTPRHVTDIRSFRTSLWTSLLFNRTLRHVTSPTFKISNVT